MPTPSERGRREPRAGAPQAGQWAARLSAPPRSVFGNFSNAPDIAAAAEAADPAGARTETDCTPRAAAALASAAPLRAAADLALARSFTHRFLAQAYEDPTPDSWSWLTAAETIAALRSGAAMLDGGWLRLVDDWVESARPEGFDAWLDAHLAAFGHAARGACPPNEIEYGELKADPLFQPHRLADLAAFYRAFGLEVAGDADERQDHICLEMEFLCVLAAKEAYALEHRLPAEQLALCRDAQRKFLREHLGRWTPAFARRLAAATNHPALGALAELTCAFVEAECARFGLPPGSVDLLLRPADDAARMCDGCGLAQRLPGAEPTEPAAAAAAAEV